MATLIESLNANDKFAQSIGIQLTEVREGYAKAEVSVEGKHLNAAGVCHGGVIFTLADLAFAAVCNCHGIVSLGINNNITYIKSGELGDHLTAECQELVNHYKLPYYNVTVKNQNGDTLAMMTAMGYRTKREMPFSSLM